LARKRARKIWKRIPWRPLLKWGGITFAVLCVYFVYDMPGLDDAKPIDERPSISILASDGTMIARYGGAHGDTVALKKLPPYFPAAVIAIEDRRFYRHFGVDPIGLARAIWTNISAGGVVQGGSTITQQLAKNMFLTPEKTLRRKVQEALMALWIERKYSKDEILAAYVNRVYYGAGAYGVDAASRTYFNKPPSDMTLWESATLAGLLKAPSRFSPANNPELSKKRTMVVIEAMKEEGYIDAKTSIREIKNAKARKERASAGDMNRYFSDWVIDQIDGFIESTDGDVTVRTTLDPKLQMLAVEKQKESFALVKPEDKVSQTALVTMGFDGAVLAMTGGTDYRVTQFNRATQARRQPGSSFKPFVYLAALENGFSPDTEIEDGPITEGKYRPGNYDSKYFGTVPLSYALAKSLNTATIRIINTIGIGRAIDVAMRAGISSPLLAEPATALGTGEVSLVELTGAYTTLANGGYRATPYAVLSIKDKGGRVLYEHESGFGPRVFSGGDIARLDQMLQQVVAIGTGTGAQLKRGRVAGKTGTTQNYRDAWFIGYTDNLVTGVWVGNDDETPMKKVTGGKYPAMIWRNYMAGAIDIGPPDFVAKPGSFSTFSNMLIRWSSDDGSAEQDIGEMPEAVPVIENEQPPASVVRPSNTPSYNR